MLTLRPRLHLLFRDDVEGVETTRQMVRVSVPTLAASTRFSPSPLVAVVVFTPRHMLPEDNFGLGRWPSFTLKCHVLEGSDTLVWLCGTRRLGRRRRRVRGIYECRVFLSRFRLECLKAPSQRCWTRAGRLTAFQPIRSWQKDCGSANAIAASGHVSSTASFTCRLIFQRKSWLVPRGPLRWGDQTEEHKEVDVHLVEAFYTDKEAYGGVGGGGGGGGAICGLRMSAHLPLSSFCRVENRTRSSSSILTSFRIVSSTCGVASLKYALPPPAGGGDLCYQDDGSWVGEAVADESPGDYERTGGRSETARCLGWWWVHKCQPPGDRGGAAELMDVNHQREWLEDKAGMGGGRAVPSRKPTSEQVLGMA
ncbi:unnamed protein product [Mesocestoides corti]|uniref:Uncharacterized protein n=1 Tax=Mesocestoides corti TaxID=53468 RepID=A0A158QWE2_MESCO|nr:unnamed protein product [Mesocestoides corti]